ncbi:MAG: ferredoxin [Ilumatobacteraceae bacterium]
MSEPDRPTAVGGTASLTVRVDHEVCSGTAHCQQSMPDVFVLVDRKAHIRADVDWSAVDVAGLHDAAEACPWFAISVTTSPGEAH